MSGSVIALESHQRVIYGRPNSDRASYGNAARSEDVHLVAWLAQYGAHQPSSLPALAVATAKVAATYTRMVTKTGRLPAEQWVVRQRAQP